MEHAATPQNDRESHWDEAYRTRGAEGVSWFQTTPKVSLELFECLDVDPTTAVVDVGGGASLLVDNLIEHGYSDVTVLDLSDVALAEARRRLKPTRSITWLHEDILSWQPSKHFGVWHDRAVFHFLTRSADQSRYLATMLLAAPANGTVVMATFADDGPGFCSGLPVTRFSAQELVAALGEGFTLVEARRELHTTPSGVVQPFTWVAGRFHGDT